MLASHGSCLQISAKFKSCWMIESLWFCLQLEVGMINEPRHSYPWASKPCCWGVFIKCNNIAILANHKIWLHQGKPGLLCPAPLQPLFHPTEKHTCIGFWKSHHPQTVFVIIIIILVVANIQTRTIKFILLIKRPPFSVAQLSPHSGPPPQSRGQPDPGFARTDAPAYEQTLVQQQKILKMSMQLLNCIVLHCSTTVFTSIHRCR